MYTCIKDSIIFDSGFNEIFNHKIKKLINKQKKIIFANCSFTNYNDKIDSKENIEEILNIYIKNRHDFDFDDHIRIKSFTPSKFDKPIDNKLPQGITTLILGWSFNQTVCNLPLTLKEIIFGHDFDKPVDNLPFTLEIIVFGYSFNHLIDNLPNSIKIISLGDSFNQLLDDLPNGIETLCIGKNFSYPINNLPKSLIFLTIKSNYDTNDIYQLPFNLELITFIHGNDTWIDNNYWYPYTVEKYNRDNINFKFYISIKFY